MTISEARLPGPCQGAARIPRYKHIRQAHQIRRTPHQRRMRTELLTPDAPCVIMHVDIFSLRRSAPPLAVGIFIALRHVSKAQLCSRRNHVTLHSFNMPVCISGCPWQFKLAAYRPNKLQAMLSTLGGTKDSIWRKTIWLGTHSVLQSTMWSPFQNIQAFACQLQLYVCECLQHPLLPLDHSQKHIPPRHLAPLHMQASFDGDDASVEIQDK